MGLSDLNFASGFSQGMNQGISLLDSIDRRAAQKKQAARDEVLWKERLEDRKYTLDTLRPFEEEKRERLRNDWDYQDSEREYQQKRRPIIDSQHDAQHTLRMRQGLQSLTQSADRHEWAGEKQQHWRDRQPVLDSQHDQNFQQNYAIRGNQEERAQANHAFQQKKNQHWEERQPILDNQHDQSFKHNQSINRFKFDHLKKQTAREEAQYMRQQQQLAIQQSAQYYETAIQALKEGDEEAANYYMTLSEQQGLPLTAYLDGSMDKALQVARGIDTGKLDVEDPAVLQQLSPLMENTMRASGRLQKGYQFAGLVQGKTGGYIPVLATPEGKIVPATHGGTGEADDEVIELSREQLRHAAQTQGVIAQQIKQRFGDVGHQYVNKPTQARLLNPNASGEDRQVQYSNGVIKQGGTRSWRNNNGGNLEYHPWQKKYGAIGSDGRFAIFATPEGGDRAAAALLRRKYGKFSIKGMVAKYAPKHENDTEKYTHVISKAAGVSSDTKINHLSPDQFLRLTQAMRKHEGWKAGKVIQNASVDSQSNIPQPQAEPKSSLPLDQRMKQQRYRLQTLGGLSTQPAKKPAPVKLGKNDRLVDPSTGKTIVGAASAQNKTGLADQYKNFAENPEAFYAQTVEQQFPDMPRDKQFQLVQKLKAEGAASPEAVFEVLKEDRINDGAKRMANHLMTAKNDALAQKTREAGLNEKEAEALAKDVMAITGVADHRIIFERYSKELDVLILEKQQDDARAKRYQENRYRGTDYDTDY